MASFDVFVHWYDSVKKRWYPAAADGPLPVLDSANHPGDDPPTTGLDRNWGGMKVKATAVSGATAATVIKAGPGIFAGVKVINLGTTTTVTVYDNASAASGKKLLDTPTASVLADSVLTPGGQGVAVQCDNGIVVVVGGTGSPVVNVLWL